MERCKKAKFPTKIDAKIALATAAYRDRDEKRYYYCKKCRAYHLTSKG